MVDSEYSKDNYKLSKIIIGEITKHSEMLRFILDHFKTKKMCKLQLIIAICNKNVSDRYKTQEP